MTRVLLTTRNNPSKENFIICRRTLRLTHYPTVRTTHFTTYPRPCGANRYRGVPGPKHASSKIQIKTTSQKRRASPCYTWTGGYYVEVDAHLHLVYVVCSVHIYTYDSFSNDLFNGETIRMLFGTRGPRAHSRICKQKTLPLSLSLRLRLRLPLPLRH